MSKRALEPARGAPEPGRPDAEHRQAVELVELDGRADDLEQPRDQAHAQADRLRHAGRPRAARWSRSAGGATRTRSTCSRATSSSNAPRSSAAAEGAARSSPRPRRWRRWRPASSVTETTLSALPITRQRSTVAATPRRPRARRPCRAAVSASVPVHSSEDLRRRQIRADQRSVTEPDDQREEAGDLRERRRLLERRLVQHDLVAVVESGRFVDRDEHGHRAKTAASGRRPARYSTPNRASPAASTSANTSARRCSPSRAMVRVPGRPSSIGKARCALASATESRRAKRARCAWTDDSCSCGRRTPWCARRPTGAVCSVTFRALRHPSRSLPLSEEGTVMRNRAFCGIGMFLV